MSTFNDDLPAPNLPAAPVLLPQPYPLEGNNSAQHIIAVMGLMVKWEVEISKALAAAKSSYSFDHVVAMVAQQRLHIYDFEDCLVLMQVNQAPNFSTYHCFVACGNMQTILAAEKYLNDVALTLKCRYLTISGRVGWPRALKPHGWEHVTSTLYKTVVAVNRGKDNGR
jgi:hypothetical protein